MIKSKLSLAGLIFILIAAMMITACSDSDDEKKTPTAITQAQSQTIAENFVQNSPTFTFDGTPESLTLTNTLVLRCPSCWQFIFKFESRHAGYGDRTDQILAQVITPHTATVTVNQGTVTGAHLDSKWDMLKQELLEQDTSATQISLDASSSGKTIQASVGATITVSLDSNPTTGFTWSLIDISDETVLEENGHIFEATQATESPMVGAGGLEVWTFKAIKDGSSTITMAYSRPWESVSPEKVFTLTINAGP